MIDDARLFLAPPPYPHKFKNWPSVKEIVNIVPDNKEIIIFEDVIYIYNTEYNTKIRSFFQEEVTDRWKQYGKDNKASFVNGLKIMIRGIINGKFV
ncbi:hypothetical protein [Thermodesulfovibrio yellowstonii]|uniref:hypothetical protein n=1 Tax=Thermodesulfovibrio yellowstonii TaxID=28262 RepID=UPI002492935E|nr:hypothetical protein [Thermodesulfovibrio islandicus]